MRWAPLALVVVVAGTGACAGILGIKNESKAHPFEHRAHTLEGIHCIKCHTGIQTAGDQGDLHLPSNESCVKCHEKPHDTRPCNDCHGLPYTRASVARAREVLRFSHAEHAEATHADCVKCHADAGSGSAILRPKMATCLGCHQHDKEMSAGDCDGCHVDLRDEGTMPEDHLVHGPNFAKDHAAVAQSSAELCKSCHSETFCASCHAGERMPTTPDRLAFDDPRSSGLHRANFLARHADEAKNAPGLCTTCHAPEGCASCHQRENLSASGAAEPQNPHPAGWVGLKGSRNDHGQAAWRDPMSCEACHGGAGEKLCIGCHQVGAPGGDPHPPGRAPVGSKVVEPCVRCHIGGR
jgi:hypothetical protein